MGEPPVVSCDDLAGSCESQTRAADLGAGTHRPLEIYAMSVSGACQNHAAFGDQLF
jgi:hypothetical protein